MATTLLTDIVAPSSIATINGTQTLTNKTLTSPQINTSATLLARGEMRFADSDSSNYVAFKSAATVAADVVWTLPAADGVMNQILKTDGAGTLSWGSAGAGGGTLVVSSRSGPLSVTVSGGNIIVGSRAGDISVPI